METCVFKMYSAYHFNWPYFTYATSNKYVMIYNAFNPTFI